MQDFVHLHVHTQYSILDGQASIPRLVDKAIADGMKGIAVTDHGDMFGIKEFFNYVNKKNGKVNGEIKDLKKKIAGLERGKIECENPEAELVACKEQLEAAQELAKVLETKQVVVKMKAGEGGKTFGSISTKEIVAEFKAQHGIELDKKKIMLADSIKAFGNYEVAIKLHPQVTGKFTVKVTEA